MSTQELNLDIATESMTIAALRTQTARLATPLLQSLTAGVWKGDLRYRRGPNINEGWSGQVQLNRAVIPIPGLAEPLHVRSSVAVLDGAKLRVDKIVARVGAADVTGEYHYEPGALRPHRFRLVIPAIDGLELQRLLTPTLRRDQNFFARTLGIGKPEVPDWLAKRFMDGTIQIGKLTVGDAELEDLARASAGLRSRRIARRRRRFGNGKVYGRITANLTGREPVYDTNFHLDSFDFKGGKMDADGRIRTRPAPTC